MLPRSSRLAMIFLFLAMLLIVGGATVPVYAAGESAYIEELVHAADIDHVLTLIQDALNHLDGLSVTDHSVVYDALGRTNTALDLLYDSGATGDVFNAAEHLLLIQRELLQEVEQATLSGNLADLSTVAPLLVELAQARLAFERQAFSVHNSYLPSTSSYLSRDLFGRRSFSSGHLFRPGRSFSSRRLFLPSRSFQHDHSLHSHPGFSRRLFLPSRSFLGHDHSLHSHPGRTFLELRRSRLFDFYGRSRLYGTRSPYSLYGR